jgi:uncharacterized membrane protein
MNRRFLFCLFQIMAAAVLVGFVTFIVISAVGVYYCHNDFVRLDSSISIPILFEAGLALSISLNIAVFLFFGKPRHQGHHILTLPLFVGLCIR